MINYVEQAIRTESPTTPELISRLTEKARAVHALLGLQTEIGELADGFKRAIYYGKPLDATNVKEEIGDILWYMAVMLDDQGLSVEECMLRNIEKLKARYPEKYSHDAALNRDLIKERDVLEGSSHQVQPD